MSTQNFSAVMEKLRRTAALQAVKSDLNVTYRSLGILERRTRIESEPDTARLADLVLSLAQIKGRLETARAKAAAGDPSAKTALLDVERLDREIDEKLKSHCKLIGDYTPYIDRARWARRILKRHREDEAEREAARRRSRQRAKKPPVKRGRTAPKHVMPSTGLQVSRQAKPPATAAKAARPPILKRGARTQPDTDDIVDALNGMMAGSNPYNRR